MDEIQRFLKALVLLQLSALPDSENGTKPELLLQRAGFSIKEIAEMLDKTYAAVAKTISRGRGTKSGAGPELIE